MKGVVLAGGTGSRLFPLTKITNKHLLPVWDKPMIYYPLECLARAGIEEVLLVTGGNNAGDFIRLLGRGEEVGIKSLQYTYQDGSGGIAQALGLAREFAAGSPICLILGDNIIEKNIKEPLRRFCAQGAGARILLTPVDHPEQYGVAELEGEKVVRIVEKPTQPRSNLAVIGIYFYDSEVFDIVRQLKPSARGELEITDVNNAYLERGQLAYDVLDGWWADAGEDIEYYYEACQRVRAHGANHV